MDIVALAFACLDFAARETALFAAAGFALLGASDLALDLIWIGRRAARRLIGGPRWHCLCADTVGPPQKPGWLAIFVPAWDEAAVIGRMLDHALATFDHPDYRLYVGCYPNDPATIDAVRGLSDPRVRLVIGTRGIM